MKKIISIAIATLLFSSLSVLAAPSTETNPPTFKITKEMLKDFDNYAEKARKDWGVPGMAIGIVEDDKLIYAKGFGVKTVGGSDPITPDTLFQIGSTTKAFTSTLVAMLVDENKVKWDDRVINYLPDFMMYDPWVTREFQVVDLMAQRSGLPDHSADALFSLGYDRAYVEHAIRYIKPVTSFRTQFAYQNNLLIVVGDLIEKISGKSWEENIKARIFQPLQMSNSSLDLESFLQSKNVSSIHGKVDGKVIALAKDSEYLPFSYTAGPSGAINSNITDMAKWLSFQMNNGRVGDKQLVSENNLDFTHTPKTIISSNLSYALGWMAQKTTTSQLVWHDGATLGMKTMIAFLPKEKVGIVILSNLSTELPEALGYSFFDRYDSNKRGIKNITDISQLFLQASKQKEQAEMAKTPIPSEKINPSLPQDKYTGNYFNDICGTINVSVVDGKLVVALGPKGIRKMNIKHWNRDIFTIHGKLFGGEEELGSMRFDVDKNGNIKGFILDMLSIANTEFKKQ